MKTSCHPRPEHNVLAMDLLLTYLGLIASLHITMLFGPSFHTVYTCRTRLRTLVNT